MAVNPDIVHERLVLMREMLEALDAIGPVTLDRLQRDITVRLATERVFTQLVELAVAVNNHLIAQSGSVIPKSYRETFPKTAELGAIPEDLAAELAPSAGLRNILIHDYVAVDRRLFAEAMPIAADLYKRYVAAIASYLSEHAD
ncbi:DUF86 domain-containing protein [Glycomyces sp. A-F 0318]|uniref:type VII toxin-antitoxin system HepT family RNase toxin n=1 Tax=Glycomyces amatae TaxID=2881355 RepID=UPI001E6519D8|nr:HepT-like ribonuclease domain-containing protein [Glycomyces amatae]MCD0444670.1 DUF86 domain-containing protein [Glycomyces amatae]